MRIESRKVFSLVLKFSLYWKDIYVLGQLRIVILILLAERAINFCEFGEMRIRVEANSSWFWI